MIHSPIFLRKDSGYKEILCDFRHYSCAIESHYNKNGIRYDFKYKTLFYITSVDGQVYDIHIKNPMLFNDVLLVFPDVSQDDINLMNRILQDELNSNFVG
jgi:hypothetical protein